jgi:hypothetical protein
MRIYTRNLNLPRRSAKRLLQIRTEAVHGGLAAIAAKLGDIDLPKADNIAARILGYQHRTDQASCHQERPPSLLDEELDEPADLLARLEWQAQRAHDIWPALTLDEARFLVQAWRPSAGRAVFDPANRHPELYMYRADVTHRVLMAPLGRFYLSKDGALLVSPARNHLDRYGSPAARHGELRLAMLFDPYDGACHMEIFLVKRNGSNRGVPDMMPFLHRAWTRLGVPDTLQFKTPAYRHLYDVKGVLDLLPKRLHVKVEFGQVHIEHIESDPDAAAATRVLDLALREADNQYAYPKFEPEDTEWVWHEENLVLLGALASERFPRIWSEQFATPVLADRSLGRRRCPPRELESGWMNEALNGAANWSEVDQFYVYNWDRSPDWMPYGLGINTDATDIQYGHRFEPLDPANT